MIVDDEPLARLRIADLLGDAPGAESVGEFGDPRRALTSIRSARPDLVFLDVQMPGMTGLDVLRELRATVEEAQRPYIVLVTAFDDYALEAFEYEALDYLVKPFEDARFHASLRRARQRIDERDHAGVAVGLSLERVQLGEGRAALRVAPESILWVESAGHLVLVHTRRRTAHVRTRMAQVEEQLARFGFVRVHRGALVNARLVESLQAVGGEPVLMLEDGSQVAVSRRRLDRVRAALP